MVLELNMENLENTVKDWQKEVEELSVSTYSEKGAGIRKIILPRGIVVEDGSKILGLDKEEP